MRNLRGIRQPAVDRLPAVRLAAPGAFYFASPRHAAVENPTGASPYGALDIAGNVMEWVADWYGDYSSESVFNPNGPANGGVRVLHGGAWLSKEIKIRAASRGRLNPSDTLDLYGFCCTRSEAP